MDDYFDSLGLLSHLTRYVEEGIRLFLSGRPSTPERTVRAVMEEKGEFMADFVPDDYGRLKEIRFDRVKNV